MGGNTSASPGGAKRGPDFINPNEVIEEGEWVDTERVMSTVLVAMGALLAIGNEGTREIVQSLREDLPTLRALISLGDMYRGELLNLTEQQQ